ncbi:hypothetical protein [Comamonas thiooxydans]|uniref:hypothetical protein n=1 Tax=Comamonas thiooxydans TaxID=363952 RepID=UPI000B407567|nr:hypothetical protein [Comamonas thiooxydans]
MFAVIIAVVAIALVVVVILATTYFGGDTLTHGKKEAEVAQAVNELGQIKGALMAYDANEGQAAESMADLIPNYIKSPLAGWGIDTPNSIVFEAKNFKYGTADENRNACRDVNVRLNLLPKITEVFGAEVDGVPNCNNLDQFPNFYGCCEVPDATP